MSVHERADLTPGLKTSISTPPNRNIESDSDLSFCLRFLNMTRHIKRHLKIQGQNYELMYRREEKMYRREEKRNSLSDVSKTAKKK